jgi:hypothetical protein
MHGCSISRKPSVLAQLCLRHTATGPSLAAQLQAESSQLQSNQTAAAIKVQTPAVDQGRPILVACELVSYQASMDSRWAGKALLQVQLSSTALLLPAKTAA